MALVIGPLQTARAATPIYVRPGGDDTLCDGTVNVDYVPGIEPACAVQTIQRGVDLVDPAGTVNIAAGTYTGTIDIDARSGISLIGEDRDTVVFRPASTLCFDVGGYGCGRRTPARVVSSTDVVFQSMTMDFVTIAGNNIIGVLYWDSTGTLDHNVLENMSRPDASGYYTEITTYVRAPGFTDGARALVTYSGNIFVNAGRLAILSHDYAHVVITGNTFYKTVDDFGYAMEIGSESTADITGNTIYGYDTPAASDGSASAGIYIENCFTNGISGVTKSVTLTSNEIYDCQYAIYAGNEWDGYAGDVDIVITATDNNIHDNLDGGVVLADEDREYGSSVTFNGVDNTVANNGDFGYGFYTYGDGDITLNLVGGTITGHTDAGIYMWDDGVTSGSSYELIVRNQEITGGTGTPDGIYIGDSLDNLQILDNTIHNLGGDGIEYASGVTVAGVHEVQGNLFQNNAGYGVNNGSATTFNVEYNSWNDYDGPTGTNGDGANGPLDYTPWTHVAVFMASSGTPIADRVAVGSRITYTIQMDAREATGADFDLGFDNTRISVVSITNSGAFQQQAPGCVISTPAEANASGAISFCGYRTTALNGLAQAVYQVVFQGVAAGTSALNLDETDDQFGMSPPYGGSNNIYAASLTDGSVIIYNAYTVTGRIDLQGRPNDSGAVMTFQTGLLGYGPYPFSASDYWGSISATGVAEDTYVITVSMPRYLDVTVASGRSVAINASKTTLATLVLWGGDANDDDMIDLSDATIIGGQYGAPGSNGDINNDGTVDILDLALMGGNYGKDSATAYSGWTP